MVQSQQKLNKAEEELTIRAIELKKADKLKKDTERKFYEMFPLLRKQNKLHLTGTDEASSQEKHSSSNRDHESNKTLQYKNLERRLN